MTDDLVKRLREFEMSDDIGDGDFSTVIEPGWRGFLTLELTNHGYSEITIESGMPIAQILFHLLAEPTEISYRGKYQNQVAGPQPAILGKEG